MFRQLIRIFSPPIAVFAFHLLLIAIFNIYLVWPWFDIPMHFIGGVAIALTALMSIKHLQKTKHLGHAHPAFKFLIVVSLVSLAAVLWEFAEFALDSFTVTNWQGDINDTLFDLLMGLVGGAFTFLISLAKK